MASGKKSAHNQKKYDAQWAKTARNKVAKLKKQIEVQGATPDLTAALAKWEAKIKNGGK